MSEWAPQPSYETVAAARKLGDDGTGHFGHLEVDRDTGRDSAPGLSIRLGSFRRACPGGNTTAKLPT